MSRRKQKRKMFIKSESALPDGGVIYGYVPSLNVHIEEALKKLFRLEYPDALYLKVYEVADGYMVEEI